MATIRQYFETDFSNTARLHVRQEFEDLRLEASVQFDFAGYFAFLAYYIPDQQDCEFFSRLIKAIDYGRTKLTLDGKVTIPSARQHPGELRVENSRDFQVFSRYFEDPIWISTKELRSSQRVYIYTESILSDDDVRRLKDEGTALGHELQLRTPQHATKRSLHEKPLAFICHDSRDKEAVARKIAIALQRMVCPVWYDEFSLKVGDPLRESIEKGLKECHKCILILSPHFLSNNGWTKKEFNSIFTREILEEAQLVLPIWVRVTKEQIYEYSPSLLNVKGLQWKDEGEEELCRELYRAIIEAKGRYRSEP
jgi:hypothetical protein